MPQKKKSVAIELIALKKPSALDKVLETIPKPKGAIPNFGLPRWKVMALESKIPMVRGPEGSYCFTRQKLGKKLWTNLADSEFNLSDPYNYDMDFSYEPLHDEYLAPFFSRPNNIKHMIKLGFVTKNLDAKCSLRDYNIYRKFLKKLHNYRINQELRLKDQLSHQRRILQLAEEQAQREIERLKKEEKRAETSKEAREKFILQKETQLRKQKENQLKIAQKLELIALTKKKDAYLRHERGMLRAEQIRQKRATVANIERQKVIKTLMEWHKSESKRKKIKMETLIQEQEKKRKIMEEKWELRQEMQRKQIQREQFVLRCAREKRTTFIKQYNNKVERERQRMKNRLKKMKKFTKCYMHKHVFGQRERVCCKNYERKCSHQDMDRQDIGKTNKIQTPLKFQSAYSQNIVKKKVTENEKNTMKKLKEDEDGSKKVANKINTKKPLSEEQKSELRPQTKTKAKAELITMKLSSKNTLPSQPTKNKCKCQEIKDKLLTINA